MRYDLTAKAYANENVTGQTAAAIQTAVVPTALYVITSSVVSQSYTLMILSASFASASISASYAPFVQVYQAFSTSASYASRSLSSSYAPFNQVYQANTTSASYASSSLSASYAPFTQAYQSNTTSASYASSSLSASYAPFVQTYQNNTLSSSYASASTTAGTATTATNLGLTAYSISVTYASQSRWATSSSYASSSLSASYAPFTQTYQSNTVSASYASSSLSSSYSTSASYATSASWAPSAGGNYLPSTGGTVTGQIVIQTGSGDFLRMGPDGTQNFDYVVKRNPSTGYLNFNGTQIGFIGYTFDGPIQGSASYANQSLSASYAPGGVSFTGKTDSTVPVWQGNNLSNSSSIIATDTTVRINSPQASVTAEVLYVRGTGSVSPNFIAEFTHDTDTYAQVKIENTNAGNTASADLIIESDKATESQAYLDLGINSSGYGEPAFSIIGALDSYLYAVGSGSIGGDLAIGTLSDATIFFHTSGSLPTDERFRIAKNAITSSVPIKGTTFIGVSTLATSASYASSSTTAFSLGQTAYGISVTYASRSFWATSASYASSSTSASYAPTPSTVSVTYLTASSGILVGPGADDSLVTLYVSASNTTNDIFEVDKSNGEEVLWITNLGVTNITSGSITGSFLGNTVGTSSWASNTVSASYGLSASYATTMSYVSNVLLQTSSSFASSSVSASYLSGSTVGPTSAFAWANWYQAGTTITTQAAYNATITRASAGLISVAFTNQPRNGNFSVEFSAVTQSNAKRTGSVGWFYDKQVVGFTASFSQLGAPLVASDPVSGSFVVFSY